MMPGEPSPTKTFLLTDSEGSTRLWEADRDAMGVALATHDTLLRAAIEDAGGTVVKTTGDGVLAAFDRAEDAVTASIAGQRAMREADWPATGPLRIRTAIHAGSAEARDDDCFGPALDRTARLLAIARGGAGAVMLAYELVEYEAMADRVRMAVEPTELERAWAEGRALSTDVAVAFARAG